MHTTSDLLDGQNDFIVFTPGCLEVIEKSGGSADELEQTRPIGGVCSTEDLDRQDEKILAKGLDFSEFVNHGYYNDNHKQETSAVLGAPRLAELRKSRWWTEGNLLTKYEPADKIWELAKALAKSNINRRLGFSIEGKVVDRDHDNRVLKAKIRHVAITNSPVNVSCDWTILAKSFGSPEAVESGQIRRNLQRAQNQAALQEGRLASPELELTFDDAVKLIKSVRQNYTWGTCERVARLIFNQQKRSN